MILKVTSDAREFTFHWGEATFRRSLSQREQVGLEEASERLARGLAPGVWQASTATLADLQAFGAFLGALLPTEVRDGLSGTLELDAGPLLWELAWWDGRFLWERLPVARVGRERKGMPKEVPPALLAVGEGGCVGEAERFFPDLTRAAFAREWGKGYGAAHLVLFASSSGLALQDGNWLLEAPVTRHAVPRFVFLEIAGGYLEEAFFWLFRLGELGVEAAVVTAWDAEESLREGFYSRLLEGAPWGEALLEARRSLGGVHAGRYLCAGDLSLRWADMRPLTITPADAQSTLRERWTSDLVLHVVSGPEEGRQIALFFKALRMGSLVIGAAGPRDCDIELEDPQLDNQAARLLLEEERLWLVPLAPLRVNGLPVSDRLPLSGDETLEMGSTVLRLASPARAVPARVEDAPEAGRWALGDYELGQMVEVVGRSSECSVVLTDPAVSRRHATVTWRGGAWHLGPVGSGKVAVNGVSLDGERALRHGDVVQLSSTTVLRFADLRR